MVSYILALVLLQDANHSGEVLALQLKAKLARERNRYERALNLLEQATLMDPDNPDIVFDTLDLKCLRFSRSGWRTDRRDDALMVELVDAIKRYPQDYRFQKLMGIFLTKESAQSQTENPAEHLNRALELMKEDDPDSLQDRPETLYFLGQSLMRNKHYYDASRAFESVIRLQPDMTWAWYHGAQSLELSHQLDAALDHYQNFQSRLQLLPKTTERALSVGMALIRVKKDPTDANVQFLADEIERNHMGMSQYLESAIELIGYRYFDAARSLILMVPEAHRRSFKHLRSLNICFAGVKAYDDAFQYFSSQFKNEPDQKTRFELFGLIVENALLSGQVSAYVDAMDEYASIANQNDLLRVMHAAAVAKARQDPTLWQNTLETMKNRPGFRPHFESSKQLGWLNGIDWFVARLFSQYADYHGAVTAYERVTSEQNLQGALLLEYADALALDSQWEPAFKHYTTLLNDASLRSNVLNNYGYFLAVNQRDLERASRMVEEAIELDDTCHACLDSLGWIHFKMGRLESAQQLIERGLDLGGADAEKLDHLGDVYWAQGRREDARRSWSQSLEHGLDRYFNFPQFHRVRQKLERGP